jgi:type VI secretion system protein ImpM
MVFGKVPTQGDFVRVNMGREGGPALEAWLGSAVEHAQGQVPERAVRFLGRMAPTCRLVAGAWVPSQDAVGRAFPLAIFCDIEDELSLAPFSALPTFLAPWFEHVEALARSASQNSAAAVAASVGALDLGHPSTVPAAVYRNTEPLMRMSVSELASELYEQDIGALDQLAYGLTSVRKAVQRCRTAAQERISLDAPCKSDFHVFAWLEVVRRVLGSSATPWFVATESSTRRTLVSLGGLSDLALAFLLDPDHPSAERWPLRSPRADVAARIRGTLPSRIVEALTYHAPVDSLFAALEDHEHG